MAHAATLPSIDAKPRLRRSVSEGILRLKGPPEASAGVPECADIVPERFELGRRRAKARRLRLKQEELDRLDFHGFGGDVDGFRAFLGHRFGSAARGWRQAFAPDGGVRPALFSDFCAGLRRSGYQGQALSLWKALSKNAKGTAGVTLAQLEPDLAAQLDALVRPFFRRYKGGTALAWQDIERDHAGRASFREFGAFFTSHGLVPKYPKIQLRRIFDTLDVAGLGTITEADLRFLELWAQSRLGTKLSQPAEPRELSEEEPWSPPPAKAATEPDLQDFRAFLRQKFGTPARAWRVALDLKGCGALSSSDFGKGCRSIAWRHHHADLYRQLEEAGGGTVSLRALDPETAAAIGKMTEAAKEKYGGLEGLWAQLLDPRGTGAVSRSEFVGDLAQGLGLTVAEARLLFAVLDTAGTGWVAECEIAFLQTFETRLPSLRLPMGTSRSLSPSASACSSPNASLRARLQARNPSLSSPAKSTRATLTRALANTHRLKHRYLEHAVQQRCLHQSLETVQAYHRSTRSTCSGEPDLFRSTNLRIKALMDARRRQNSQDLFDDEDDEGDED